MQTELGQHQIGGAVVCEPAVPVQPHTGKVAASCAAPLSITLLTGGQDPHYAAGLATALMEQDVSLDVIGSDEIDGPAFRGNPRVRFHNLHGMQNSASPARKISRTLLFYARLLRYTLSAKPRIFHILWNNRLPIFDRTLIMLLYRLRGKKVILTAHNVNADKRDKKDSWLNRITLRCQYTLANHVFVHTKKMKDELINEFSVKAEKVTIIPYGINNAVPFTDLSGVEARQKLGLRNNEKVILYFGAIKQYKGLEYLVSAFQKIAARADYRLIIAGEQKKGHEEYWRSIRRIIECSSIRERILQKIEFIPDAETETYFKAADVAALSYVDIFQSGILFMAYNYGLPVIATDVGSFSDDIVEGKTGFVCRPRDSDDLARTLELYFESDLYQALDRRRHEIRDYALSRHSWGTVACLTKDVYSAVLR